MNRTTRKLQKVGGGTFTVSVPKEWATEHGLTAGTPIHLYSHVDGSLVVRRSDDDGALLAEARIELDRQDSALLKRMVQTAYAIGFESITLVCLDGLTADQRRTATEMAQKLVGMEIVRVEEAEIEFRNVIDPAEVSIQQSVTQLQFVVHSMYRTAIDALFRDTDDTVDQLTERDDEADRVFELITRYLNRSLMIFEDLHHLDVRRSELFDYYLVARQLEGVGDQAEHIGTIVDETDIAVPEELRGELQSITADTGELIEEATAAVLSTPGPAVEQAHGALTRCEELREAIESLDRTLFERSPPEAYFVTKVLTDLARIVDHGGRIAEIALQVKNRPTKQ